MSDAAKNAIRKSFSAKGAAVSAAHQIVIAYAGSANAIPSNIPYLFEDLVELFTTGETQLRDYPAE